VSLSSKMTVTMMEGQLFTPGLFLAARCAMCMCMGFICSDVSIIVCLSVLLPWPLFFRLRLTAFVSSNFWC
jgi:hypothetical protein